MFKLHCACSEEKHGKQMKKEIILTHLPPFGLGFVSLGVQIVFLRLLLEIFQGNELSVGLVLSVWLVGSALGATVFQPLLNRPGFSFYLPALFFPVLLADYVFIKLSPHLFKLLPGVQPNLESMLWVSLGTILPAALFMGALFPYLVECTIKYPLSRTQKITEIYRWESAGAFAAGLLLNFILFYVLNSFQIFILCLMVFYLFLPGKPPVEMKHSKMVSRLRFIYLFLCLLLFPGGSHLVRYFHAHIYQPYLILSEKDTPYGNLKVTRLEKQMVLFFQGKVLYSTPDPFSAESRTLLPLLLHSAPKQMLILGGNLTSYLPYLQKISSLEKVVYVEIDPVLVAFQQNQIDSSRLHTGFKLEFVVSDIRKFLALDAEKYDLICLNQPEASTLNLNRLYSQTFVRLVKQRLRSGGIYFFTIRSSENYLNKDLARYINILKNTVESVFPSVFIVPGDENHFLASDTNYFADVLTRYSEKLKTYRLSPTYFVPAYLNFRLSAERVLSFGQQLARHPTSDLNTDFNLKAYLYHFRVWNRVYGSQIRNVFYFLERYRIHLTVLTILLFLALRILLARNRAAKLLLALFTIGGVSISLEMVLLLQYQILFGVLYSGIAILFGMYMLGLAAGTVGRRKSGNTPLTHWQIRRVTVGFLVLGLCLLAAVLPEWNFVLNRVFFLPGQWLVAPAFIFCLGFFTGRYFYLTTEMFYRQRAAVSGLTYGVDLAGSVLGVFTTSIILVPILGIPGCLVFLLLILLVLLF